MCSRRNINEKFKTYDQVSNLLVDAQGNLIEFNKEHFTNFLIDAQSHISVLDTLPKEYDSILNIFYVPPKQENLYISDKMNKELETILGQPNRIDKQYVWWINVYPFSKVKYDFVNKKIYYYMKMKFTKNDNKLFKSYKKLDEIKDNDSSINYEDNEIFIVSNNITNPLKSFVIAINMYLDNDLSQITNNPQTNLQLLKYYKANYVFLN